MPGTLVMGLVALPAGVISLVLLSRLLATRNLEAQIRLLEGQVVGWQSMHDHQVASMDRRLLDLEECAARAEEETRLVSLQMERISHALGSRAERSGHALGSAAPDGDGDGDGIAAGRCPSGPFDRGAALVAGGGW